MRTSYHLTGIIAATAFLLLVSCPNSKAFQITGYTESSQQLISNLYESFEDALEEAYRDDLAGPEGQFVSVLVPETISITNDNGETVVIDTRKAAWQHDIDYFEVELKPEPPPFEEQRKDKRIKDLRLEADNKFFKNIILDNPHEPELARRVALVYYAIVRKRGEDCCGSTPDEHEEGLPDKLRDPPESLLPEYIINNSGLKDRAEDIADQWMEGNQEIDFSDHLSYDTLKIIDDSLIQIGKDITELGGNFASSFLIRQIENPQALVEAAPVAGAPLRFISHSIDIVSTYEKEGFSAAFSEAFKAAASELVRDGGVVVGVEIGWFSPVKEELKSLKEKMDEKVVAYLEESNRIEREIEKKLDSIERQIIQIPSNLRNAAEVRYVELMEEKERMIALLKDTPRVMKERIEEITVDTSNNLENLKDEATDQIEEIEKEIFRLLQSPEVLTSPEYINNSIAFLLGKKAYIEDNLKDIVSQISEIAEQYPDAGIGAIVNGKDIEFKPKTFNVLPSARDPIKKGLNLLKMLIPE